MYVEFEAEPYRWAARTETWVFADLPEDLSADIAEIPRPRRGFGSLRVRARVGLTVWSTSIFPLEAPTRFILPLKRAVREAEGIELGRPVTVHLELLDL